MGKLIDADELMQEILDKFSISYGLRAYICDIIKEQPTAYDVDKVVEQLEKESYQEFCDSERIVNLIDAIEIVKGGGKDEM